VERATRSAAATGATFLTVHGHDRKTVRAALAGKAGTPLRVLAVTVLTNLTATDLAEQGLSEAPEAVVARRARLAHSAGCDGIVAAGGEAAAVRALVGPGVAIVTPGIRLASDAAGDQARITAPGAAILAGADYLVVGRPISSAPDPRRAAEAFVAEIDDALARRALGPPS
jgi:orotidine-5'-phosphate decarboxylase